MSDFYLRVSTDVLKSKADEIKGQIQAIETNWKQLCSIVERSAGYWEGEAGDYHRKMLKDNEEDVQKIIRRLNEHPVDLLKMAGIYEKAEVAAKALANTLSDHVIS